MAKISDSYGKLIAASTKGLGKATLKVPASKIARMARMPTTTGMMLKPGPSLGKSKRG